MKDLQYTVRNIPVAIDDKLRKRARATRRSLNQVTIEVLAAGLSIDPNELRSKPDLSGLAAFDRAEKSPSRLDKNKSIKQLYRESMDKKYGLERR